ncbi:MAG TPA: CopD family protein, partial [Acidimicrobiia bacterium]
PRYVVGVIGAAAAALSLATDGHTVSQGNVALNASLDVVHVLAAGIWVGGIVGLLVLTVRRRRRLEQGSMATTIVRFSSVATLAIVSVAAAGFGMSLLIIDSIADYVTTDWGRLLLLKVALVAIAVGLGAYNHFVAVPALEVDPTDSLVLSKARRTTSAEAAILLVVTLLTVFLTGASINQ